MLLLMRVPLHEAGLHCCRNYKFSVNGGIKRGLAEMLKVRLESDAYGHIWLRLRNCKQTSLFVSL